jgi:hypothetical protein
MKTNTENSFEPLPNQVVGRTLTRRTATAPSIFFSKYYAIVMSNWVNWLAIYAAQIHRNANSIGISQYF